MGNQEVLNKIAVLTNTLSVLYHVSTFDKTYTLKVGKTAGETMLKIDELINELDCDIDVINQITILTNTFSVASGIPYLDGTSTIIIVDKLSKLIDKL